MHTLVNASQAVVLPTFLAMPVFSNDPPCATWYSPMAKTFPGGMQFLDRVSSLCYELMTKSDQQSVKGVARHSHLAIKEFFGDITPMEMKFKPRIARPR